MKNQKIILFVSLAVLLCVAVGVGLSTLVSNDAKRQQTSMDEATAAGLDRAKQECKKEGISDVVCRGITGVATESECNGMTCWIVYARSESDAFGASVTVTWQQDNGKYVTSGYLRDTGLNGKE